MAPNSSDIEYYIFGNSKNHTLPGKGFLLFLLQEYFENLCPTNMGLARKQFSCSKKVFSFPISLKTDQILKDLLKYLGFRQGLLPLFLSPRGTLVLPRTIRKPIKPPYWPPVSPRGPPLDHHGQSIVYGQLRFPHHPPCSNQLYQSLQRLLALDHDHAHQTRPVTKRP